MSFLLNKICKKENLTISTTPFTFSPRTLIAPFGMLFSAILDIVVVDESSKIIVGGSDGGQCTIPGGDEYVIYETIGHDRQLRYTGGDNRTVQEIIANSFSKFSIKRHLLHEIYVCKETTKLSEVIHNIAKAAHSNYFVAIAEHGDHVHVIHDCSYTSNTCRCTRIGYIRNDLRRVGRRNQSTGRITREYWENIINYFYKGTRELHYLEVGGEIWIQGNKIRRLRFQTGKKIGQEKLVEDEFFSRNFFDDLCHGSDSDESGSDKATTDGENREKSKLRKGNQNDRIYEFILKFPCAPLNMIFNLPQWIKGPYKYLSKRNPKIDTIMNLVKLIFCDMTTTNYFDYFNSCGTEITFNAPFGNIEEYYYDLEKSIFLLNEILLFQYNENIVDITNFLKN